VLDVAMDIMKSTRRDEEGWKEGRSEGARDGKERSSLMRVTVCVLLDEKEVATRRVRKSTGRFLLGSV
jgi:hypothetical protein